MTASFVLVAVIVAAVTCAALLIRSVRNASTRENSR